jgi:hypothetical protein
MGRVLGIAIPVVVLLIIGGLSWFLYWLGGDDQSALEKLRDIVLIFLGILWVLAILLLAIITGLVLWLVLTIKDKVLPTLDSIHETVQRLKGTAEFMTEEIATPVISFYATIAKARATTRTLTGRDKVKSSTLNRLLRR